MIVSDLQGQPDSPCKDHGTRNLNQYLEVLLDEFFYLPVIFRQLYSSAQRAGSSCSLQRLVDSFYLSNFVQLRKL